MYFWRDRQKPSNLVMVGATADGWKQVWIPEGENGYWSWENTPGNPGTPMIRADGDTQELHPYSPAVHDVYDEKGMGLPAGQNAAAPHFFFGVAIGDDGALRAKLASMNLDPNGQYVTISGLDPAGRDRRDQLIVLFKRQGAIVVPVLTRKFREGSEWVGLRDGVIKPYIAAIGAVVGLQGVFGTGAVYSGVAATTVETGAMNAALAESAVGTSGYGASSVGAGNAYGGATMFDGFNWSEGISSEFIGDAQLTNFGTGYVQPTDVSVPNGWDFGPDVNYGDGQSVLGNTPDPVTNDYGTTFNDFGTNPIEGFTTPDPITIAPPETGSWYVPPQTGNTAGGMASLAKTTNDALGTFAAVLKNVGAVVGIAGGVKAQIENPTRTSGGQLRPAGGASQLGGGGMLGGMSQTTILLGAAGLLLVGFLVMKK